MLNNSYVIFKKKTQFLFSHFHCCIFSHIPLKLAVFLEHVLIKVDYTQIAGCNNQHRKCNDSSIDQQKELRAVTRASKVVILTRVVIKRVHKRFAVINDRHLFALFSEDSSTLRGGLSTRDFYLKKEYLEEMIGKVTTLFAV